MFTFNAFASEEIKVTIDGKAQTYDVMPIIENGRTLVPMRGIFEALGAEINWEDATKTVSCAYYKGYNNVLEIVVE